MLLIVNGAKDGKENQVSMKGKLIMIVIMI